MSRIELPERLWITIKRKMKHNEYSMNIWNHHLASMWFWILYIYIIEQYNIIYTYVQMYISENQYTHMWLHMCIYIYIYVCMHTFSTYMPSCRAMPCSFPPFPRCPAWPAIELQHLQSFQREEAGQWQRRACRTGTNIGRSRNKWWFLQFQFCMWFIYIYIYQVIDMWFPRS